MSSGPVVLAIIGSASIGALLVWLIVRTQLAILTERNSALAQALSSTRGNSTKSRQHPPPSMCK